MRPLPLSQGQKKILPVEKMYCRCSSIAVGGCSWAQVGFNLFRLVNRIISGEPKGRAAWPHEAMRLINHGFSLGLSPGFMWTSALVGDCLY